MKETILTILVCVICGPILVWLIKTLVVDIVINTYKDSYKGTPKARAKAILRAIGNGLIMIVIMAFVGMCAYNPDPEHNEKYDEYQQRREPRW
jgi:hypothetical protein